MQDPIISVIIPVHNAQQYISSCLDSILADQETDLEVICVDDCSTDSSVSIIEEYICRYPNVKLLKNETNLYAGPSRNRGLLAASGKYVHFVDADDLVCIGAYQKMLPVLEKNDLDWLKGLGTAFDDETGKTISNVRYSMTKVDPAFFNVLLSFHEEPYMFLHFMSVVPWNTLYKKSFLIEKQIRFNSLFCVNDRSFYIEACLKGRRVMIVREELVRHRTNVSDSLVSKRLEHFDCQFESFRIAKQILRENKANTKAAFHILDAELCDIANWYSYAMDDEEYAEKIKEDVHRFLDKEVDTDWFIKKPYNCQWRKRMKLAEASKPFLTFYSVASWPIKARRTLTQYVKRGIHTVCGNVL